MNMHAGQKQNTADIGRGAFVFLYNRNDGCVTDPGSDTPSRASRSG